MSNATSLVGLRQPAAVFLFQMLPGNVDFFPRFEMTSPTPISGQPSLNPGEGVTDTETGLVVGQRPGLLLQEMLHGIAWEKPGAHCPLHTLPMDPCSAQSAGQAVPTIQPAEHVPQ